MARTIFRLLKAVFAFGCFGLFGIIFIVIGFQSRARFSENQKRFRVPTQVTMAQIAANPPSAGWLQIKEGTVSALDTIYIEQTSKYEKSGTIQKMLIPVFTSAVPDDNEKAPLVILTEDQNIRNLMSEAKENGWSASASSDDEKEMSAQQKKKLEAWLTKNLSLLYKRRPIEGMVRSEEELDSDAQKAYNLISKHLAPKHVILEEGVTPKTDDDGTFAFVFGGVCLLLAFVVGGLLGFLALLSYARRQPGPL